MQHTVSHRARIFTHRGPAMPRTASASLPAGTPRPSAPSRAAHGQRALQSDPARPSTASHRPRPQALARRRRRPAIAGGLCAPRTSLVLPEHAGGWGMSAPHARGRGNDGRMSDWGGCSPGRCRSPISAVSSTRCSARWASSCCRGPRRWSGRSGRSASAPRRNPSATRTVGKRTSERCRARRYARCPCARRSTAGRSAA